MEEVERGAAITIQMVARGYCVRKLLWGTGHPGIVGVLEKASARRKAEAAKLVAASPMTKVQRSNSFGLRAKKSKSRVERAKAGNDAKRKMLNSPATPSATSPKWSIDSPGGASESTETAAEKQEHI